MVRKYNYVTDCMVCGKKIYGSPPHPFCKACGILVGPDHDETELIDGLCFGCNEWKEAQKEKRANV